jgi:FtsH-binding integral membrane protein
MGKPPQAGSWLVWTAFLFTIICLALVWHAADAREQQWPHRVLRLALVALATFAALATVLTAFHFAFPAASSAPMAAGRTLVICLLAVLLGWSGSRFRRAELLWLAYAAIAFCTLKLLLEDLRSGSAVTIAFSFFCYGMVWVLVPRFSRATRTS